MNGEYVGWTPPPGVAVVAPPVHPETRVSVLYSDGAFCEWDLRAGDLNWSAVGDGPAIVAYAVVEEYKPAPEPREWWLTPNMSNGSFYVFTENPAPHFGYVIHVREVPDPSREVVAWAVVRAKNARHGPWWSQEEASEFANDHGGTVVRLSGVMPNG